MPSSFVKAAGAAFARVESSLWKEGEVSVFAPAAKAAEARRTEGRAQLVLLPAGSIRPNPYQPRRMFDETSLAELGDSIRQSGLIQPLVVRQTARGYELIAGERRLRACQLIGMQEVPCIVRSGEGELESAFMALVENVQRQNLHFFEEADCYRALLRATGMTQAQLAVKLGKSQSFLANKLRLLRLPAQMRRRMVEAGLSERHARALLRLNDERTQDEALLRMTERRLSVKESEQLVERLLQRQKSAPRPRITPFLRDCRLFFNVVNQAAGQLRAAGYVVETIRTDVEGGADFAIRVRKAEKIRPEENEADYLSLE